MNSDHHGNIIKKLKRDLGTARPDITHQTLLALMDSPLNRANLLQVYIKTAKNVLIEINPQVNRKNIYSRVTFKNNFFENNYFIKHSFYIENIV